jgi:hypothetical protein
MNDDLANKVYQIFVDFVNAQDPSKDIYHASWNTCAVGECYTSSVEEFVTLKVSSPEHLSELIKCVDYELYTLLDTYAHEHIPTYRELKNHLKAA